MLVLQWMGLNTYNLRMWIWRESSGKGEKRDVKLRNPSRETRKKKKGVQRELPKDSEY